MAVCETCGNDYDKAFEIHIDGGSHTYDSFECAIHAHAPSCKQCNTRILGHGIESAGDIYCCAHCASRDGVREAVDRVS